MAGRTRTNRKDPRRSLPDFCRGLAGTTESIKWGDHLVFSVGGKMYALFDADDMTADRKAEWDKPGSVRFKCDDDDFERLTELPGVIPAPYMARLGWVRVEREAKIAIAELRALIAKAHGLALSTLPKRTQARLRGAQS